MRFSNTPASTGQFRPDRRENGPIIPNPPFPSARARGRSGSKRGNTLPPLVSSYIDPFSEEAACVRYPDSYRGLSGTFTTNFSDTINTPLATYSDPNLALVGSVRPDTCLFLLTPDPSNFMVTGLCGTPGSGSFGNGAINTWSWPNGVIFSNAAGSLNAFGPGSGQNNVDFVAPNIGAIRNQYSAARLVSGGVKISGTQNFSTVSGTIHMAPVFVNMSKTVSNQEYPGGASETVPTAFLMTNGWQPALPQSLSDLAELPGYQAYPVSSLQSGDLIGLFKRAGDEALLFKPLGTAWGMDQQINNGSMSLSTRYGTANIPDNYGHYCICVYVEGALSSTGGALPTNTPLIRVQMRNHYEAQLNARSMTFGVVASSVVASTVGVADAHMAAPHQPLLLAAADNLCTSVPAVREVAADGDTENAFIDTVASYWGTAKNIASSVFAAYDVTTSLMAALVI